MSEAIGLYTSVKPVPALYTKGLFEAQPFKDSLGKQKGEPKFSAIFVYPPESEDLKAMKALAVNVARAAWPGVDLKEIQWPFKAGDKYNASREAKGKKPLPEIAGKAIITARSKYAPRLSGVENGNVVDYEDDAAKARAKAKFFSGVEVLTEYNFVATEVNGDKNVSAYLNQVFTTNKGVRAAGGRTAAETFKDYIGHRSAEDPTAGADLDDEIPF